MSLINLHQDSSHQPKTSPAIAELNLGNMTAQNLFSKHTLIGFAFLLCTATGLAQVPDTLRSIFEHLTATEGIKITLEADLTTIIANKKTNQYFPGTLITEDGKTYAIELRPRGKFRRKISEIPPLKIKFKKN